MAIQWADIPSESTGIYGTNKAFMTDGIYGEITSAAQLVEDPDPNITGTVLYLGSAWARFIQPAASNHEGIACRIWIPNIPISDGTRPAIHQYRGPSNEPLVYLYITPTGAIAAYRWDGASATLLGQTAGPVITANAWRHIESDVIFDNSTGAVKVWVEGVLKLNLTGVDTNSTLCAQKAVGVAVDVTTVSQLAYFKDVVFRDASGTQNTSQIGPCQVYWKQPNGDISSGWSRSSGSTDYGLVDESPPVDAGYIYAGDPPPAPSIMDMSPLPADIISIRGILPVARAEKSDGGDGNLQISISPNGTDWDTGADNPLSTAFTYYWDVSEVSPDTSSPWTPAEFATLQYRLDRTV